MSKTQVPLDQIIENPYQVRMDNGDTEKLAQSILDHGLRQLPEGRLLADGDPAGSFSAHTGRANGEWAVTNEDATVQLASGHRRVEAVRYLNGDDSVADADLRRAGLAPGHVPVDVQRITDEEMLDLGTIENIDRKNLSPIEEARLIKEHADAGRSNEEIGELFDGRSGSWVSNRKRLLNLPGKMQSALHEDDISTRQAQAILPMYELSEDEEEALRTPPPDEISRYQIAQDALNGRASSWLRTKVKNLKKHIETVLNPPETDDEDDLVELPEGWQWTELLNSHREYEHDYRAVKRYDWEANGTEVWLVATANSAEECIRRAREQEGHDHSAHFYFDSDGVVRGLPPEWVWEVSRSGIEAVCYADGHVTESGDVRRLSVGTTLSEKADQAWKMHRATHESTDETNDDRPGSEKSGGSDEGDPARARQEDDSGSSGNDAGSSSPDGAGQGHEAERESPSGEANQEQPTVSSEVSGDGVSAEDEGELIRGRFRKSYEPYGLRITEETLDEIQSFGDCKVGHDPNLSNEYYVTVETHEGTLRASYGDWIFEDSQGRHYPIEHEEVDRIYELVGEGQWESSNDQGPDIGQVVPGQVDILLSADGEDMWDEAAAEMSTIPSLLVAHRVAGQRQETWRTQLIAEAVKEKHGKVTEDDVPDEVMEDVREEVDRRLTPQAA